MADRYALDIAAAVLASLPAPRLVPADEPITVVRIALPGLLYAVCGVLDHLDLARRFPPVPVGGPG